MTNLRQAAQQALEGECNLWAGGLLQGYGIIYNFQGSGKRKKAHVAAWEALNGPVPTGFVLDHLCRRRSCTNPKHLELVTSAENTLRGNGASAINARRTHCIRGHELSGENLGMDYRGHRRCKTCQSAFEKAAKDKRKTREQTSHQSRA